LFPLAGNVLVATVVNVILTVRLYAMYQNRKVLSFCILLNICGFALEVYASTQISILQTVIPVPIGIPMPGCIATYPDMAISLVAYVPILLIATTFFAMTVRRAVTDRYGTRTHLMDMKYLSPLVVSIVRDGALFYMLLFVVVLIGIVVVEVSTNLAARTTAILTLWRLSIYSWSGSRLVLNLREAARRGTNLGRTTISVQTMTAPAFALNPIPRQNQSTESVA